MGRLRVAALPALIAASGVLLMCGGYASPRIWPWLVPMAAGIGAVARWGLSERTPGRHAMENGLLAAVVTLAVTQVYPQLYPLMYLLGAGYVLALPLRLGVPLVAALIALDVPLQPQWPVWLAHASFTALFAALYHALLGARLAAARRAETTAVRRRVADAEERARELRLGPSAGRPRRGGTG